ncbi:MAG TPA: hypothetical protein DGH68_01230, partial [Bacteroidetes bacterium]|nr:hypothetical protein [Bacteroidota bacterium]
PFVVTLYMFVIFLTNYDFIQYKGFEFEDYSFLGFLPPLVKTYFKSLALVVFQSSILPGIVFCVVILFFSRVMFILSIVGFAANYLFVQLLFQHQGESFLILSGFNSVLTAFALGGNLIIPSRKSFVLTVIAALMVVIVTGFFMKVLSPKGLPLLVLPFNFVTLSVLYSLKFRKDQSDLVLLYFQPGSPEENYYYHHTRLARFDRFKTIVPELPFFGKWTVSQGHNGAITHKEKWKHAWDFVVKDNEGSDFSGTGSSVTDYHCFKLPVVAVLDGTAALVVESLPNNDIGEMDLKSNWGNTVIIDHGQGIFSSTSHLDPSSTKVKVGESVKKGDVIARCGNSGRSPTPHLHFQFQPTDRLGDNTLDYPIGHYLEKNNDGYMLHTFDVPAQNMEVQNIEVHKIIQRAFELKYGDKMVFDCATGEDSRREEWEVRTDIYNNLFIQSSAGATAYFVIVGKIFYMTDFMGKRDSALYWFYLMSVRVPLCYEPNLRWDDRYPLSKVMNNLLRYTSEFLLVFNPQIKAGGSFRFKERSSEAEEYTIANTISAKGSGLFSFFKKTWEGELSIDRKGSIKQISIVSPNKPRICITANALEEKKE